MHRLQTYIVEDSPVIRDNLIATLEELVPCAWWAWAADEPRALQWLRRARPPAELVIVDIFLKAGSGLGVLRSAQACRARPATWWC
jgi:DNA-binding NarL/FixJ family response regulator